MNKRHDSPIVLLSSRLLSPYIMLFGLYVIFHGHYSPGGGFQGGAMLAASALLMRIAGGDSMHKLFLAESWTLPMAIVGVIIYFGTGLTAVLMGGHFLDYGQLPLGMGLSPAELRYWGILIIEVGIGMAVMAILVMIYDNLMKGEDHG